jgi:nitrogenase cofactor biosynthesis protein NifB
MNRNYVNLNVNPCKMCMPLGGVLALKGIENSMVILHGSQGCSTYIRRHMAAHYNEPVDIASSSLNEHGTVYGGADNLKKGIQNMYQMYSPKVIGVLTTCLAETIGEDTKRITTELKEEDSTLSDLTIITSSTAGYAGSQYEGYFRTLKAIVEKLCKTMDKHSKINVILPPLSPGDVRNIKDILDNFEMDYILFPDISDTLDAPYKPGYKRIPEGGTKLEDIISMSGSRATIEMAVAVDDTISPGHYLKENFGVPLFRVPIPIGLQNCDIFYELLSALSNTEIPLKLKKERGRLLDAMIDGHKYNSEIKTVVFGEPELSYSITSACLENGIKPVVVATGTKCSDESTDLFSKFKSRIVDASALNENKITLKSSEYSNKEILFIDDTDFETIEKLALKNNANMMIGNSDGRRIEHKHGIDLIRIGFPIHDRLGGQRKVITGYNGTIALLDETSNTIIAKKESNYRQEMYESYYKKNNEQYEQVVKDMHEVNGSVVEIEELDKKISIEDKNANTKESIEKKTLEHPCYNGCATGNARMHIPVAPKCNISCNYCSRKYDCVNESRPGVTSEVLSPEQALEKFKQVKAKVPNLTVLGIAGPGDALANFEETKKSIELIKAEDPSITFCLSTNGLMLPFYAEELVKLGITHITITINTIDPAIGAKLYRQVNYLGQTLIGEEGAAILLQNQLSGLRYLTSKGVVCKVNIVMVKGVNDEHIPEVVKKVKECGAFMTNIMQMIPAPGSRFENMPQATLKEVNEMRKKCEVDLKQMYHCRQCRADAIGTLGQDRSIEFRNTESKCESSSSSLVIDKKETEKTATRFAVATKTGLNIDLHFGQAEEFYVYDYIGDEVKFVGKRTVAKYCNGPAECDEHEDKFAKIFKAIEDCNVVLAMRAGDEPIKKLEDRGIKLFKMYENIQKGISQAMKLIEEVKKNAS